MKKPEDKKTEDNVYSLSYGRMDRSIEFTGLVGQAMTDKYREGDLLLNTNNYRIKGIGSIAPNTHLILNHLCAFNKNIQGILIMGEDGKALVETGNGFKVMVRQSYDKGNDCEKEINGDRKQRIIDFLVKEILKIFGKEKNQNTFNIDFARLAEIGLGVELDNMVDLNEEQKQGRLKRLNFLKDIQAKVALRINQQFAKRGMESEWNWDYGKKRLMVERKKKG